VNPLTGVAAAQYWLRVSGTTSPYYFTDCDAHDLFNGLSYGNLVLSCNLQRISGDALQNNLCIHNTSMYDLNASGWRVATNNPAVTIVNNTGFTVTLAVDKAPNGSNPRTATLTINGTPNTYTINQTGSGTAASGTGQWTFGEFVAWLNGFSGISATIQSAGTVFRLFQINYGANSPTVQITPTIIASGAGTIFGANYDEHADASQQFGTPQNCIHQYNRFDNIGPDTASQIWFFDHSGSSITFWSTWIDYDISYNFSNPVSPSPSRSQINSPASHVSWRFNTFVNTFDMEETNTAATPITGSPATWATIVGDLLTINNNQSTLYYVGQTVTGTGIPGGTTIAAIINQWNGTNAQLTLSTGGLSISGVAITITPNGQNWRPDQWCEFNHNVVDLWEWQVTNGGVTFPFDMYYNYTRQDATGSLPYNNPPDHSTGTVRGLGENWVNGPNNLMQDTTNYYPVANGKLLIANDNQYSGCFLPSGAWNDAA
jgi:hypothetical protein